MKIILLFSKIQKNEDIIWKLLENMWNPLQNPLLKCTILYYSFKAAGRGGGISDQLNP